MTRNRNSLWLVVFAASATLAATPVRAASPLAHSTQCVVVTTGDWESKGGTLRCLERSATNGPWRSTGAAFPVVMGRNGLGWGRGLSQPDGLAGPVKREGDGRSPAGIFLLSSAFGYAPASQMTWARLPYVQCTATLRCVDDTNSVLYNTLVDTSSIAHPNWQSAEEMRRPDDLYRLGIFVEHNTQPRVRGGGSCIFLHIWASPQTPTTGCTAMAAERLEQLLQWLRPEAKPVLVQLPQEEYRRLQQAWALPALPDANAREGGEVNPVLRQRLSKP